MLPASQQFHNQITSDVRRVFGRVSVDYTDTANDQSITVLVNESVNTPLVSQVADGIIEPQRRWASVDGSTFADGNSFPAPSTPAEGQMGWWGSQTASAGGAFITPFPTLTISFASRPIHTLRVVSDVIRGEFAVDFEIRLLGVGGILRHTRTITGNSLIDWQEVITPITEVTQYVLEIRRWSHVGRQAKVLEAFTSIQETYEGDNLLEISLLEERGLAHGNLPVGNVSANEISIKLDNLTRKFDAGNRQSPLYQLLVQNRRIRAWLGTVVDKVRHTETSLSDFQQGTLADVRAMPVGNLELTPAVSASLARDSIAYLSTGVPVDNNLPRFEAGRFGQAMMVEDGTTNLLTANQSSVEDGTTTGFLSLGAAVLSSVTTDKWQGNNCIQAVLPGLYPFAEGLVVGGVSGSAGTIFTGSLYFKAPQGISFQILLCREFTLDFTSIILVSTGVWQRVNLQHTLGATTTNLSLMIRTVNAQAITFWVDGLQIERRAYATTWQLGGTPRVEELISAPLENVVLPLQGTVEFWWNPQIPFSAIVSQATSPILLQIGNYHSNASLTLWAFTAGVGVEPHLVVYVRGQTAPGWSISISVLLSGSGWYQRDVFNHYAITWSAGHNFRVYRNGILVGGPYTIADPITSWAGTQIWFANDGGGQGTPGALIDDIRISRTERTATEILTGFNSGQPLAADANTTLKHNYDGQLFNYLTAGSRVSPVIDLSSVVSAQGSSISWQATTPTGTGLNVESRLSVDGGSTWQGWMPCTNGGSIPGIAENVSLANTRLQTRQLLTATTDSALTPQLHELSLAVKDIEYVPLGTFWSSEWHVTSETLYASTIGRDRLEQLRNSTYSVNQLFVNQSLYTLATNILTDAGLTIADFWVDPALQHIVVPNAWFGTLSHREALRQIAEASLGQVYADRNGIVRIEGVNYLLGQESFVSPLMTSSESFHINADNYFQKDTPVKWGELANRIEVETQPLSPVPLMEEVYRSNEPVPIEAGQTLTVTVFYNVPPVIDARASLVNPPAGKSITGAIYYAWGADVTVTSSTTSTFTLSISGRPLIVQNRNKISVQDDLSIRSNGLLRYLYPNNHLVQTRIHAQMIADALLRLYKHPRRDLIMDWRGNPALTLGDMVTTQDHAQWLRYWIIKQEIDFDGALRAKIEGRLTR